MTNLHHNTVIPDFCGKGRLSMLWTVNSKKWGIFPQDMVIPGSFAKIDVHPCFALYTLKSDEFPPEHGYSWFLCKSWHSSMLCTFDSKKWLICTKKFYSWFLCKSWHSSMFCTLDLKKWRICTKIWFFLISVQK